MTELDMGRVRRQAAVIVEGLRTGATASRCKAAARRRVRSEFADETAEHILALARVLRQEHGELWFPIVLIRYHRKAFELADEALVASLGEGLGERAVVDSYARVLVGPAWLCGKVSDSLIESWARSCDRWRRREALLSTVALNRSGDTGGQGDAARTLAICELLAGDADPQVGRALATALKALAQKQPGEVQEFLDEYAERLPPRVTRAAHTRLP